MVLKISLARAPTTDQLATTCMCSSSNNRTSGPPRLYRANLLMIGNKEIRAWDTNLMPIALPIFSRAMALRILDPPKFSRGQDIAIAFQIQIKASRGFWTAWIHLAIRLSPRQKAIRRLGVKLPSKAFKILMLIALVLLTKDRRSIVTIVISNLNNKIDPFIRLFTLTKYR